MLKLNIDGETVEVEGLDVNVNRPEDEDLVHVIVYRSYIDADGYNWTDMSGSILNITTNLDPDLWGSDEWFGFDADTAPGDFPGEVLRFITPFLDTVEDVR